MAKDERRIVGAVSVAGFSRSFVAGDEDALADAIANDTEKSIDVDHLTKTGAIVGFGGKAEAPVEVVNRQRKADGSRADAKAVEAADTEVKESSAPRSAPVKQAPAKGERSAQKKGRAARA
jgi:hypothetical protein